MKRRLIPAVVLIVLIALAFAWWRHNHLASDGNTLVLHGNVDIRQVALAFDGNGRILELRAEEGDRVKEGDLLAVLDTRTLALQAEQARAQIQAQRQTLLRLRNGSRPQEIEQARARLAGAQSDAEQAARDFKRLQGIAAGTQLRGVSPQDLDRARSRAEVARANAEDQREALRLAELGPREEDIAQAQAQLDALQAELALLQHQISQGTLKAPIDAVVRSRLLEPGDMATPEKPVYALALTHPKWVRAFVAESDLGRIRPGMAAQVTTDSRPDQPVEGRIGFISSVAEFTPKPVQTEELRTSLVYEVRVIVQDADDALRLGQPATIRMALDAPRP
jgi:HlyD family secretion protein